MANKQDAKGRSKKTPDDYFVQIYKTLLEEPAWKDLSPGARVLYIAVKSFYNGSNNGELFLSIRTAAQVINASPNSVERWFKQLVEHGFIRCTREGALGSDGKGQARYWRLTEIGWRGERPTRDYKEWEKQNPAPILGTGCPNSGDSSGVDRPNIGDTRPNSGDGLDPKSTDPRPNSGDISNLPLSVSASAERKHSLSKLQTIVGLGAQTRRQFQVAAIFSALVLQSQSARAA